MGSPCGTCGVDHGGRDKCANDPETYRTIIPSGPHAGETVSGEPGSVTGASNGAMGEKGGFDVVVAKERQRWCTKTEGQQLRDIPETEERHEKAKELFGFYE